MITRFKSALRLVGLLLVCSQSLACANILGIDEPVLRSGDTGGAGGSPEAGAAGEGEGSIRPLPQIQGKGSNASQVGSTPNHLVIDGPHSVSGCPDSPTEIKLSVGGGDGKYSWEIDPPDPTFVLKEVGTDRAQAVLTGTLGTKARTLTVRARDNTGASNVITTQLKVANIPVIEPPALGSVCQDELYALDLHASGGDEAHYVWSSDDLPASSGLTLSADGHLAGKFTGVPSGPSQLKFTVNVADGTSCIAAPAKVSLTVNGAGASVCPTIGLQGQLRSRGLPPLCLAGEYNEQLNVTGGTAPYTWTHSALPSGLSLDSTGKLSGTFASVAPRPVPPAAFAIQVVDSKGRQVERRELVPVREKCWFAYVAKAGAAAQLNFFDPVLANRRTPPNASPGDVATDFKFSPNGRFIAYRLITSAGVAKLSVIDLSTWQQSAATFSGVTNYAWSSNSGTLGVAYTVGSDTVIGGFDVANPLPGSGANVAFPTLAAAVSAIDSELVWFGPDPEQIAMLAKVGGFTVLESFNFTPGVGFTSPLLQTDELPPPTWLMPARSGVFAVHPIFATVFYPSDGSFPAFHDDIVIDPRGEYVARADTGSLNVFRPADDSEDTPPFSKPGCDTIASWAPNRERLACAHQIPNNGGEITFFDLAASADPNVVALNSSGNITLQVPSGRRRLFSTSGALFAFASDQTVTIVDLRQTGGITAVAKPASTVASTAPGAAFAELAFSPDETLLLQHRGGRLGFFDLSTANSIEVVMSEALPPSHACNEDFRSLRDTSSGWCGAELPGSPFWWSSASDLAAFQTTDGTLHIYEFNDRAVFAVDDQCGQGCVVPGQANFQP